MSKYVPVASRSWCVAFFAGVASVLSGCQLVQNPFADELASQRGVTTPSVDAVREAAVKPTAVQAHGEAKTLPMTDGSVTHGPLYFEGPFEDKGSDDGKFAWTGEDYLWMFSWRGRFLLNAVAFPVSAVVTPPWTVMVSDGRPSPRAFGEQHDAERLKAISGCDHQAPQASGGL